MKDRAQQHFLQQNIPIFIPVKINQLFLLFIFYLNLPKSGKAPGKWTIAG